MQTLVERGCGLDVHQATVVACLLIVLKNGRVHKQMRTFGTTTRELLTLRDWLLSEGCTHVAMETTNIKLASVASDVFGVSGRLMLEALAQGKATPQEMAELAKGLLRKKIPELEPALEGRLEEHHRFLLELQLRRLEAAEEDLAALQQCIQEKLKPYLKQLALLDEIPGVDWTVAAVIIAELGVDMSVFGSASKLASWAGVCPGNNESAGKRRSSRVPKGNVYLKTALVEAANAATRAKGTYLRDKFFRLKARRGYKRALVAVAHKILVAIYHMLSQEVCYNDLGDLYLTGSTNTI